MSDDHHCRYEMMGLGHCNTAPGMYPCSPCRERGVGVYLAEETTTAEPKHAKALEAEMSRVTIASVFERMHEHLKEDMFTGRIRVPTGPLTFTHATPGDRHVQAAKYVIASWRERNAGIGDLEAESERYQHSLDAVRGPGAVPSPLGAIRAPNPPTLRECLSCLGSVAAHDGAYVAHKNSDGYRCLGSGQVVPDYARHTTPHPKAREPLFTLPTRPHYLGPCECGRPVYGTAMDRGSKCEVCRETEPKPPTLREWLGARVSEIGPWADVLREQPVPAGHIRRITLDRNPDGSWSLLLNGLGRVAAHEVVYFLTRPPSLRQQIDEALQMALCTRHPAVPPEPAPLRTWFGNEEEP